MFKGRRLHEEEWGMERKVLTIHHIGYGGESYSRTFCDLVANIPVIDAFTEKIVLPSMVVKKRPGESVLRQRGSGCMRWIITEKRVL